MSNNNKNIRSQIMEIIDDNSKDIPEGVYLQLCNKLQEFTFEEESNRDFLNDIDYMVYSDSDSEPEGRTRATRRVVNAEQHFARREARMARQSEARLAEQQLVNPEARRYIINPETNRQVLRTGRIGRALARQQ